MQVTMIKIPLQSPFYSHAEQVELREFSVEGTWRHCRARSARAT